MQKWFIIMNLFISHSKIRFIILVLCVNRFMNKWKGFMLEKGFILEKRFHK